MAKKNFSESVNGVLQFFQPSVLTTSSNRNKSRFWDEDDKELDSLFKKRDDEALKSPSQKRVIKIYCKSASKSIAACFSKDGMYIYSSHVVEVPKDQYEKVINLMRKRIIAGNVPGVTDPNMAKKFIVEGHYTYDEALRLAKANNSNKKEKGARIIYSAALGTFVYCKARSTAETTRCYNVECDRYREELRTEAERDKKELDRKLAEQPDYTRDRHKGVKTAWGYEKADVNMGGKGSIEGGWSESEREEIKRTGKVSGAEGHHGKSVAKHPEGQTDPNNIIFYHSRQEHKDKGHNGDFRNPSSGENINKDEMLKKTNQKRVWESEGAAAATVFVVGFTCGCTKEVYQECKQKGVSWNSICTGFKKGLKKGAVTGLAALAGYGFVRKCS